MYILRFIQIRTNLVAVLKYTHCNNNVVEELVFVFLLFFKIKIKNKEEAKTSKVALLGQKILSWFHFFFTQSICSKYTTKTNRTINGAPVQLVLAVQSFPRMFSCITTNVDFKLPRKAASGKNNLFK